MYGLCFRSKRCTPQINEFEHLGRMQEIGKREGHTSTVFRWRSGPGEERERIDLATSSGFTTTALVPEQTNQWS
jgi:hypothetical protein